MNKIEDHYTNKYDENIRFSKDQMHGAEFLITLETIKKYLKPGMKILELGAGTGAYSIQLAKEKYEITAIELVKKNLDILKSKITSNMKIEAVLGNALNLKFIKEKKFDIVLCLGPMYHLNMKDRLKCIKEASSVCKKGGILIFAFISNYLPFIRYFQKDPKMLSKQKSFKPKDDIFTFIEIDEIDQLFKKTKLKKIDLLSPDGISRIFKDEINSLSKKEFEIWLDYLRKTSNDKSLIGYGEHLLYIAKK